MDYEVKLEIFEGPLDLLLHLIHKNEVDIFDIPIAVITDQYLEYLDIMKALNINIAGDFFLMSSTLIHIKSRMLLPESREDEEEDGLVLDSSSRQKDETIQALSEMNELWCLKLSDLIDQYDDIIEEQYQQRMKKPSKED